MNQQKDYLSPNVEHRRVILEQITAATTSYSMSISGNVQYEDYAAGPDYEATKDVLITY